MDLDTLSLRNWINTLYKPLSQILSQDTELGVFCIVNDSL